MQGCFRVLAEMAYFFKYVFPRLSSIRSDFRQEKKIRRTVSCMVLYGIMARRKLELYYLGYYFGLFIFIEQIIGKKKMKKIPIVVRHIYNKIVIIIGFGIFYFEDLGRLGSFFKNLVGLNGNGFIDEFTKLAFTNNLYLIIAALLCSFPIAKLIEKAARKSAAAAYAVSVSKIAVNLSLILVSSIMLVDATNNPFLYFRF